MDADSDHDLDTHGFPDENLHLDSNLKRYGFNDDDSVTVFQCDCDFVADPDINLDFHADWDVYLFLNADLDRFAIFYIVSYFDADVHRDRHTHKHL